MSHRLDVVLDEKVTRINPDEEVSGIFTFDEVVHSHYGSGQRLLRLTRRRRAERAAVGCCGELCSGARRSGSMH